MSFRVGFLCLPALESIGEAVQRGHETGGKASPGIERSSPEALTPPPPEREFQSELSGHKATGPAPLARANRIEIDPGLRTRTVHAPLPADPEAGCFELAAQPCGDLADSSP